MKTNQEISFFMNIGGQIKQDIAESFIIKECGEGIWRITCTYTLKNWSRIFKMFNINQFNLNFTSTDDFYKKALATGICGNNVMLVAEKIFNSHRLIIISEVAEFFDVPRDYVNDEFLKIL